MPDMHFFFLNNVAILFLDIYTKEVQTRIQTDASVLIFTVAWFTTVKLWEHCLPAIQCSDNGRSTPDETEYQFNVQTMAPVPQMRQSINQFEMEENSDIHYNTVITKEVMPNKIYQTQKHKHMSYMK